MSEEIENGETSGCGWICGLELGMVGLRMSRGGWVSKIEIFFRKQRLDSYSRLLVTRTANTFDGVKVVRA